MKHLLLVPWGSGHPDNLVTADAVTRFYNARNNFGNTVYGSEEETLRAAGKKYKCRYLRKLEETFLGLEGTMPVWSRVSVESFTPAGKKSPFGTLGAGAVKMCVENRYSHVFQLECSGILENRKWNMEKGELAELIWLFRPNPPEGSENKEEEKDRYNNCTDTLLLKNFDQELNKYKLLTEERVGQEIIVPDDPDGYKKHRFYTETLKRYRLLNASNPSDSSDANGYMTQEGGNLLYAFHPVYLKSKIKSAGMIADMHLSSRQAAYKWTNLQVIPAADPNLSPYLGKIAHEYLASTNSLLKKVAEADIVLVAGDAYDHVVNLVPSKAKARISTLKDLWDVLDTRKSSPPPLYQRHIDGLMMLQLILTCCSEKKKPVFFVAGNHEGYEHPYGISPRVPAIGKVNAGIPADHNLTIYEAALLFGPSFAHLKKWWNFRKSNLEWIHQTFTPWSDYCLHHDDLDLAGLGWGDDEQYVSTALRGGTLPRATESVDEEQMRLVRELASGNGSHKILLTHFTFTSFAPEIPLTSLCDRSYPHGYTDPINPYSFGSAMKNLETVQAMLRPGEIDYIMSGHAHRGAVYKAGVTAEMPQKTGMLLEEQAAPKGSALLTGSTGPMSVQNITGELGAMGMDSPQGLVLNLEKQTVTFTRYTARPRLAVLLAYLKDLKDIRPFARWTTINTESFTPGEEAVPQPGEIFIYRGRAEDPVNLSGKLKNARYSKRDLAAFANIYTRNDAS
jgi:hypothetical protein